MIFAIIQQLFSYSVPHFHPLHVTSVGGQAEDLSKAVGLDLS